MTAGERIGHYQVLSPLGRGGMGEVWKALDTKLQREVAIKMLPSDLANDQDRLARFQREATVLAALNHPHIAAIHGLEEAHGTLFLILELVEGPTVADRVERGAVPLREALALALQLADSLEVAHAKGIIHRDLKPANIKLTADGRVKVLDFGLAKVLVPSSNSATATTELATETGLILGTPAYMSPEQARGEAVDEQADIWAFGTVLYEVLTGRSPFRRPSAADTIAQVVSAEPDYSALPADTPPSVRRLLRRCLEKERKRRCHAMSDVRLDIEDAQVELANPPAGATGTSASTVTTSGRTRRLARAALLAIAAVGIGWLTARTTLPDRAMPPVRLSMSFGEAPRVAPFGVNSLAVSDDGSHVAYASLNRLWVRHLDQKDPMALDAVGVNPFFSPDGKWVGLFEPALGVIKVPVDGGPPSQLAPTTARSAGASWRAGTIVFATTEGLFQVSDGGGAPTLVAKADPSKKERLYAWPHLMPDGRSLLFTIVPESPTEAMKIAALNLATRETTIVVPRGSSARYLPTGHLLYAIGSTLRTVAFDASRLTVSGDPVPVPEIEVASSVDNGAASVAVSPAGTLVFAPPSGTAQPLTLRWVNRQGQEEVVATEPRPYSGPRVSPDGTRVAFDMTVGGNRDVYVLDLRRLTVLKVTDSPTEDLLPSWSPDGTRLYFGSNRTGQFDLYSVAADGAGGARVLFSWPGFQGPHALTPDGTRMLFTEQFKDIGFVDLTDPPQARLLLHSDAHEGLSRVSPDGKWIAYESDEAGQQVEILIRSFPDVAGQREKVSVSGGRYPLWGLKGSNELYYISPEGDMMLAKVTTEPTLKIGVATKLFRLQPPPKGLTGMNYDISPLDGRLLITRPTVERTASPTEITVLLNWLDRLRGSVARP